MTSSVVHAAAVFLLLLVCLRALGKREMAQMSPFDLIVLFIVGDVVAESITSEDTSLTGATVVMATLVTLTVLLARVTSKWPRTKPWLDGKPVIVVRDGELDREVMHRERLTATDIREAARKEGIEDLDDVQLAVLETNGHFSFFSPQASSSSDDDRVAD